jgi:(p)ppGpp synthase/HD superfamily hydrolase
MSQNLVQRAEIFARQAHASRFRDMASHAPNTLHLMQVARLMRLAGGDEIGIATAWLHDYIEDIPRASIEILQEQFGQSVADSVLWLTDSELVKLLGTFERKRKQAEHLVRAPVHVKIVKMADQIANFSSLMLGSGEDWSDKRTTEYVRGMAAVAGTCYRASPFLDDLFDRFWLKAKKRFPRLSIA